MSVPRSEIQTLAPGAIISLFILNTAIIGGSGGSGGFYYFCSQLNPLGGNVVWNGVTYTAIPVAANGFETSTNGSLPHPTFTISNLDGLMAGLVDSLGDLVGSVVTRIQVLVKYLDAVNFSGGNANANPSANFPIDVWVIEQKTAETYDTLVFEMVAASDAQGIVLPSRLIQNNNCPSSYKNADGSGMCPYTGPLSTCDHGLSTPNGCKVHFSVATTPGGIAVDGSAYTYTRSSGSFVTDGFNVGTTFTGTGFTNQANNYQQYVTNVTATVLTVSPVSGSLAQVTESAGSGKYLTVTTAIPFGGFPGAIQSQ